MTDLAEPIPLEEPKSGLLSRAAGARLRLTWQLAALISLVVLGAGFRFWDLGSRALHHDESLHGFFAYQLFRGQGYSHDPLMHGPFQFFGTAATFFLTGGASDYTLRILPALFGAVLIFLPFLLRHRLGTLATVFAAGLIAFSPTLLYFSRFARNDIYIAVFTFGIVIALWRYVDERKPLYLFLAAGLLGLSFATKENTYLHAGLLMLIVNGWLAADLARQTREKIRESPAMASVFTLLYLPFAWAVAALWPLLRAPRERLGLTERHPAGDFLVILGTLTLPQLAAAIQVPLERIGIDIGPASSGSFLGVPDGGTPIVLGLLAATAVVGLIWNPRLWLIAAAAFYVPYVLLYTSFLTNLDGFGSGIWGSLDYWLEEQRLDQPRGDQPWFYYLMLLPTYELLALIIAAPALFYYAYKGDVFRRFLVAWVVGTMAMYIWAGEKMPWLSVHTTLPVVILAAYVLGDLFSNLPGRHRLQAIAPEALPFIAAALGVVAIGFAAFGPSGDGWVALRVILVLATLGALVWLLRPFDRRRLTVGLVAALVGGLSLFTIRTAVVATYEHGDVPRELLVYTQTSPQVPQIMDRINEAGRVSGLGRDVPVFIDTTYAWPWHWYLRDHTNVSFGSAGEGFTPPADAIVILAVENESTMQPYLDQYQPPFRHALRWWFPEFDTYKTLPRNGFSFFGEFAGSLFRASAWSNWWSYFRDRETGFGLGSADAVAFFPNSYPVAEAPPQAPPTPSEPLAPSLDDEGRLVLGQTGSQPGAFSDVSGLAVDGEGNFYVADTGNHRIQMFDPNGEFIREAGGFGAGPGQFNQPADVAIDREGKVYVVDTWNHRVQVLDSDLRPIGAFGRATGDLDNPEPDQMWGPRAVEIDSDGNLLVADTGTARIKKFSPEGQVLDVFGRRGSGEGEFSEPVGMAVAPNGDVFVADVGNARIQKFDSDFNFLASYPIEPWSHLDPNNKPYLARLPDGSLLAVDGPGALILLVGEDGSVQTLSAVGEFAFAFPRGVAVDERGFAYVSESSFGQVFRFLISDLESP